MNSLTRKKNILITGASGFLGSYIKKEFDCDDAYQVWTLGRKTNSNHHISCDISTSSIELPDIYFEKVIHVAGKAHIIPKTTAEKQAFFDVNVEGTQHLLNALTALSKPPPMIIFISSVAVYGRQTGSLIIESTPLEATTPYGISKIQAEERIVRWSEQHNCSYLNLRLPLIAGANPPGNLGAMKHAISKQRYPKIINNKARKSIVVAQDVAKLIKKVTNKKGTYNLTDGFHPSFQQIERAIEKRLNTRIKFAVPKWGISSIALIGDMLEKVLKKEMPISSERLEKITKDLTFDDTLAREKLDWNPSSALSFIETQL